MQEYKIVNNVYSIKDKFPNKAQHNPLSSISENESPSDRSESVEDRGEWLQYDVEPV